MTDTYSTSYSYLDYVCIINSKNDYQYDNNVKVLSEILTKQNIKQKRSWNIYANYYTTKRTFLNLDTNFESVTIVIALTATTVFISSKEF